MISKTGIWSEEEKIFHADSKDLLDSLIEHFDPQKPVYDFGCGTGYYLKNLKKNGFTDLIGFEGTDVNPKDGVTFHVLDLSKPITIDLPKGQVISFEVGEHIPEEYESTFIENITKYCDSKLFISWALVGQAGVGHVNCKPQEYIIKKICEKGFVYDETLSEHLRNLGHKNTPWFNNTLLVFNKV